MTKESLERQEMLHEGVGMLKFRKAFKRNQRQYQTEGAEEFHQEEQDIEAKHKLVRKKQKINQDDYLTQFDV